MTDMPMVSSSGSLETSRTAPFASPSLPGRCQAQDGDEANPRPQSIRSPSISVQPRPATTRTIASQECLCTVETNTGSISCARASIERWGGHRRSRRIPPPACRERSAPSARLRARPRSSGNPPLLDEVRAAVLLDVVVRDLGCGARDHGVSVPPCRCGCFVCEASGVAVPLSSFRRRR